MNKIIDFSFNGVDIRDFLTDEGRVCFETCLSGGQRIGQAWMNAAPDEVYIALSGSMVDPFYRDDAFSVVKALTWLTR